MAKTPEFLGVGGGGGVVKYGRKTRKCLSQSRFWGLNYCSKMV